MHFKKQKMKKHFPQNNKGTQNCFVRNWFRKMLRNEGFYRNILPQGQQSTS